MIHFFCFLFSVNRFEEELSEIFSNFADWDVDHKYSVNTISVYYENEKNIKSINLSATLGAVLVGKELVH